MARKTARGLVVLTCPKTGKEFSIGVESDTTSLASVIGRRFYVDCPICGDRHAWSYDDIKLTHDGRSLPKMTDPIDTDETKTDTSTG